MDGHTNGSTTTPLADLPPELLDHITTYLPTASALSSLSQTSKRLHTFVEKHAWSTFTSSRFPSLQPQNVPGVGKYVARTLTTLSRAWDRRAFVAKYIEPHGDITAYPSPRKIASWKRPRGQTIGFVPQLDSYATNGGHGDVFAFSAGAEVCIRNRRLNGAGQTSCTDWSTYRPPGAVEGRDDITSLHLVRPQEGQQDRTIELVTGTGDGDLTFLGLSPDLPDGVRGISFDTQGLLVRSSSLLQGATLQPLLAANLGDTKVCLYPLSRNQEGSIQPISEVELHRPTNGHRTYRAWSTNFLSPHHLAIGTGPSEDPIHVYEVSPTGISKDPIRKFALQNDLNRLEGEITFSGFAERSTSSVYPIVPIPSPGSSPTRTPCFLSGAYDGIIRLHDIRSPREVSQAYIDPTDDSAIYALLPRGHEKLVAGTSRHSLLKVFDLRMGVKKYSHLDVSSPRNAEEETRQSRDWNLFLKPNNATYPGRGGGNNWARRSAESSIYSLTSTSAHSPHIYAGVENAVVEMAFTSATDRHPDPMFSSVKGSVVRGFQDKEVLDLAMYDQDEGLKLLRQGSLWETTKRRQTCFGPIAGLDDRWVMNN